MGIQIVLLWLIWNVKNKQQAYLSPKTQDFLKPQLHSFCWFYQNCVNSLGSTASFVSAMLMEWRWWELYHTAYGMKGCMLYSRTLIWYYLSLQLAILPNYKLLRISIIRTKMWSFKMSQYDFKRCAEQWANSVFFYMFLTTATDPALHLSNLYTIWSITLRNADNFGITPLSGLKQN